MDKKSQFSKPNLGTRVLKFLGGMLEAKLTLNNLNFKCYVQFFFVRALIQLFWAVFAQIGPSFHEGMSIINVFE